MFPRGVLLFLFFAGQATAFYLPGLAPVNYCARGFENDTCKSKIPIFMNRLNSEESVIPYEYEYFDFCQKDGGDTPVVENLGQVVFGERISTSSYELEFLTKETCKISCKKTYEGKNKEDMLKLDKLKKAIYLNYWHHWIVDNMPVTWCYTLLQEPTYCTTGFPVGCYIDEKGQPQGMCMIPREQEQANTYYVYNQLDFVVSYHSRRGEDWGSTCRENGGRIIQVRVMPRSATTCGAVGTPLKISGAGMKPEDRLDIEYSYSISYQHLADDDRWNVGDPVRM
jgi:transmembrane 9 superfamily protein 2/4